MTNTRVALAAFVLTLTGAAARSSQVPAKPLEKMPAELETRYALSAVPATMRDRASVYLLDPTSGYRLSRRGTSGVTCLVQRTPWEQGEYRDDIYFPVCFDVTGSNSYYLQVILDAARLRAQGKDYNALRADIEKRYASGIYEPLTKAGVSYMVGPVYRAVGPGGAVQTMSMPHLMFYAPRVTNDDIGAAAEFSPTYPFIMQEGVPRQSFAIQLLPDAEKAKIVAREQALLEDLCAYRELLCIPTKG
jgi:hypothetical protein